MKVLTAADLHIKFFLNEWLPPRPNFFISMQFSGKFGQIKGWCIPPLGSVPLSGKSWICPWITIQKCKRIWSSTHFFWTVLQNLIFWGISMCGNAVSNTITEFVLINVYLIFPTQECSWKYKLWCFWGFERKNSIVWTKTPQMYVY